MDGMWIWCSQLDTHGYNQTMMARRSFDLGACSSARLRISADTRYRLFINGEWVNDGPCRAWPEHYQYDILDVTPYLREGANELRVLVNYYGIGTFHQVPQQAGLLAHLEAELQDGESFSLATDSSWEATPVTAWISNTPKISIQMGPMEVIDARRMSELRWRPVRELHKAGDGPWKNLTARDVALLTRDPVSPVSLREINLVERRKGLTISFNIVRMLHPRQMEANRWISHAGVLVTCLTCPAPALVQLELEDTRLWLDGRERSAGDLELTAGEHLLLIAPKRHFSHDRVQSVRLQPEPGLALSDPLGEEGQGFWRLIRFDQVSDYAKTDMEPDPAREQELDVAYAEGLAQLGACADLSGLLEAHGTRLEPLPPGSLLVDPYPDFEQRRVVGDGASSVRLPAALMADNAACTLVHPDPTGDVELVYDLGVQRCGYWELDLVAQEGVVIDLAAVEYINRAGGIQHTGRNRNVMRCIAAEGRNHLLSMRRRSGRYLFLTIRNQTEPVRIRLLRVIESTYPVEEIGGFAASDPRLSEIWKISARTLKLCMEDAFVDCPLYEQTLWIGDARNEALYAYTAFGAPDIARRCIRLGGESTERYGMVGCQVPSCWDILLPAWSFLWTIGVWEHYLYTSDSDWLRHAWPWVMTNLRAAAEKSTDQGLFTGPYWNMFDWSGADQGHNTVVHNSMLAVGAVNAAVRGAELLEESADLAWLLEYRRQLITGIERLWQPERGAYPDSIHADGAVSSSICQHTSALALLYDIAPPERFDLLTSHLASPPEEMVRVGSPFSMQYIYEALEKVGRQELIIQSIHDNYLPMLEDGATTVWETFPGHSGDDRFPTRSHAHAWSSAPIHFLNRIVLGIYPEAAGGASCTISPRPCGLSWAEGSTATIHGPVRVRWSLRDAVMRLEVKAPAGVQWRFVSNPDLETIDVRVES